MEVGAQETARVNIVCSDLRNVTFDTIGAVFTCRNTNASISLVTTPNSVVTSVTDRNGMVIANHIEGLILQNMRMNFIPNNITTMLPSLKAVQFHNVSLMSITKENMRQFGSLLEYVWFDRNQLTSLVGDLFQNNWNLRYISFHSNPIKHINPRFFETLKNMENLQRVYLSSLGCMSQQWNRATSRNISTFIWNNERCFNETEIITTEPPTIPPPTEAPSGNETCSSCLVEYLDHSTQQINDLVYRGYQRLAANITDAKENLENMLKQSVYTLFELINNSTKKTNDRIDEIDQKLEGILKLLESF